MAFSSNDVFRNLQIWNVKRQIPVYFVRRDEFRDKMNHNMCDFCLGCGRTVVCHFGSKFLSIIVIQISQISIRYSNSSCTNFAGLSVYKYVKFSSPFKCPNARESKKMLLETCLVVIQFFITCNSFFKFIQPWFVAKRLWKNKLW